LQGLKGLVILLKKCYHRLLPKNGTQSFVFPVEAQADEAIPLLKVYWWQWSTGLNPHH
jgi:hypothetical protein